MRKRARRMREIVRIGEKVRKGKAPVKSKDFTGVVELRGIEPLSESSLTGSSPGADDYLHSLAGA